METRSNLLDTAQFAAAPIHSVDTAVTGSMLADQRAISRALEPRFGGGERRLGRSEPRFGGSEPRFGGSEPRFGRGGLRPGGSSPISAQHGRSSTSPPTHDQRRDRRDLCKEDVARAQRRLHPRLAAQLRTLQPSTPPRDGGVAALMPRTLFAAELSTFGEPLHCDPAWGRARRADFYPPCRRWPPLRRRLQGLTSTTCSWPPTGASSPAAPAHGAAPPGRRLRRRRRRARRHRQGEPRFARDEPRFGS